MSGMTITSSLEFHITNVRYTYGRASERRLSALFQTTAQRTYDDYIGDDAEHDEELMNVQGGGGQYPYPKYVWSPTGASRAIHYSKLH